MDKDVPSKGKKRSLFWIVLIVLVVMMGALGWQAKSLLQPPEPVPAPEPVWAKVPPAPPTTTIQIPQTAQDAATAPPNKDGATSSTDGASVKAPEKPIVETPESVPATKQVPSVPAAKQAPSASEVKNTPIEKPLKQVENTGKAAEVKTADPKTTTPNPPEPSTAPSQAAGASGQIAASKTNEKKQAPFSIQVGAFRVKTHAINKMAQLAQKGYEPYLKETAGADQKPWYGVRFGQFKSRDQANQALLDFRAKEKMDGIVTRSNSL